MNGAWGTDCPGEVKGSAEKCDGVDNDCNGTKDDGGDSLCSGQRCGGSAGCVECLSDGDCSNRSAPACKLNYCDTSRHICSTKNANNGTSCGGDRTCNAGQCVMCTTANDCDDKTCQNKACNTSGQCAYTPVGVGDSHSSCPSNKVCSAARTCVECVDANDCDDKTCQNKACNTSGQCVYTPVGAGDGHSSCPSNKVCSASRTCVECVDATQCQSKGSGSWNCNGGVCESAIDCTGQSGLPCSRRCSTINDCPPTSANLVACSSSPMGQYCQYGCVDGNDNDCPGGMHCLVYLCVFNN